MKYKTLADVVALLEMVERVNAANVRRIGELQAEIDRLRRQNERALIERGVCARCERERGSKALA